jgi:hypothetical protein
MGLLSEQNIFFGNKKSSNLKIITNQFEIKFLQILIPIKNEFLIPF